jgi:hypothetical protein
MDTKESFWKGLSQSGIVEVGRELQSEDLQKNGFIQGSSVSAQIQDTYEPVCTYVCMHGILLLCWATVTTATAYMHSCIFRA